MFHLNSLIKQSSKCTHACDNHMYNNKYNKIRSFPSGKTIITKIYGVNGMMKLHCIDTLDHFSPHIMKNLH